MEQNRPGAGSKSGPSEAAEHVARAHGLLKAVREKLAAVEHQHPELDEAITKLEVALSILTVKTGGML